MAYNSKFIDEHFFFMSARPVAQATKENTEGGEHDAVVRSEENSQEDS